MSGRYDRLMSRGSSVEESLRRIEVALTHVVTAAFVDADDAGLHEAHLQEAMFTAAHHALAEVALLQELPADVLQRTVNR